MIASREKKHAYGLLLIAIFLSSFVSVFSKIAGQHQFLSIKFCLFYGTALFILMCYAVCWQLSLEKIDLVLAYSFRGLLSVFIYLWAVVIFHERLEIHEVIGVIMIMIGVCISQK